MFGMTNDQLMSFVRQVMPVIGTILAGLGWVSSGTWEGMSPVISQILGGLLVIGSMIWDNIANSKKSILLSAAQMPEVKTIVLDANKPETADLNKSTPANVTTTH